MQLAEDPAIELAALVDRAIALGLRQDSSAFELTDVAAEQLAGVEAVDVGVDDEEAVAVPEPQQELGDAVLDRLFAVADASSTAAEFAKKYQRSASAPYLSKISCGSR